MTFRAGVGWPVVILGPPLENRQLDGALSTPALPKSPVGEYSTRCLAKKDQHG
jgi:hypothetical protein